MIKLGDVELIERKDWNATPFKGQPAGHRPCRIVVHHTWKPTAAEYLRLPVSDRSKCVRRIQQYHQGERGWADIGYHYLIGPDGLVYEGRDVALIGSHCGGVVPAGVKRVFANTGSIGLNLIGNFDEEKPTAIALDSMSRLVGYLMSRFEIKPDQIFGHFQAWTEPPKTCPGIELVKILATLNPSIKTAWNAVYPKTKF
jgi:hypothetical protein